MWTGAREKAEIRREVTGPRGQDMRADFVVSGGSGKDCVLEVKTVVDASADAGVAAEDESGPDGGFVSVGLEEPERARRREGGLRRPSSTSTQLAAIAKGATSRQPAVPSSSRAATAAPSGPTRRAARRSPRT